MDLRILYVVNWISILILAYYVLRTYNATILSRKLYCWFLIMLICWSFFDFMFAFSFSIEMAHLFYALAMLSIGLMVGFFYLSGYVLVERCTNVDYFIASLPTIFNFLRFPFQQVELINGLYVLEYNILDYVWILLCVVVTIKMLYVLVDLRRRVSNLEIKRKISKLIFTMASLCITAALATVFLNFLHLPDITAGLCGIIAFTSYPLFEK